MIYFVIVEDDERMTSHVKEIVSKSLFGSKVEYAFKTHTKFDKELCNLIKDSSTIKVYIMDIELEGGISGLDIAKKIREDDWDSNIIFLTSHDHMFETAFRNIYNIFDFIEKFDNMDNRLMKDIKNISKHSFDNKTFRYKSRNSDLQIYYKSINYITTNDRKLTIVTDTNTFEVSMTLAKMLETLDDSRFKQTHKSTIVNKDKIASIEWNKGYFITENGDQQFLVSKNYKEAYYK